MQVSDSEVWPELVSHQTLHRRFVLARREAKNPKALVSRPGDLDREGVKPDYFESEDHRSENPGPEDSGYREFSFRVLKF